MNVRANYILILFIGFAAIFVGCERGSSGGGFEGYLERRLKDRQVHATKIECSKPLSSRAGFCVFQISREELVKLAKLVPRDDDNNYPVVESKFIYFDSSVGCLSSDAPKSLWSIDTSTKTKNEKGEWVPLESHGISKRSLIFEVTPPFGKVDYPNETVQAVSDFIIWDPSSSIACIGLHYPYG